MDAQGFPFELTLRSDYEIDPNHIELVCHPSDYKRLLALLESGLVLFNDIQPVDGTLVEDKQLETQNG